MREPLERLILVAGHAVFVGADEGTLEEDGSWLLADFQEGEGGAYVAHVRRGVELAAADPRALLVFSGGATRPEVERTEAEGYLRIAELAHFWNQDGVRSRCTTEDYARDSYENVLFGIARFREHEGRYPRQVTVVSWGFKQERFSFHAEALHWPPERFVFHGQGEPDDLLGARRGEARTVARFHADPHGTTGTLAKKREARNPHARKPPYAASCPEIVALLRAATKGGPLAFDWKPLLVAGCE